MISNLINYSIVDFKDYQCSNDAESEVTDYLEQWRGITFQDTDKLDALSKDLVDLLDTANESYPSARIQGRLKGNVNSIVACSIESGGYIIAEFKIIPSMNLAQKGGLK